ncbi:hypothetical protein [Salipiger sp. HF18]|uniref:hypothetical protein n=1 Tax=Salipiger sp. HF18 TaxID=2721557 RepID=UPI0020CB1F00|nr:hypothetical protein [Salipiger sp. HF18]
MTLPELILLRPLWLLGLPLALAAGVVVARRAGGKGGGGAGVETAAAPAGAGKLQGCGEPGKAPADDENIVSHCVSFLRITVSYMIRRTPSRHETIVVT